MGAGGGTRTLSATVLDGVPAGSCAGVVCGADKKCVMRSDSPKCICAPNCKRRDGLWPKGGPVCGTDGVSYKSHCRLKKRSCRTRDQSLTVNYRGPCQSECIKRTWTTTRAGRIIRLGRQGVSRSTTETHLSGRAGLTFFSPFFTGQTITLLPSDFL